MTHVKRPPRSEPRRSQEGIHVVSENGGDNILDRGPPQAALHAVFRLRNDIAVEVLWSTSGDRRANVDFVWSHRPEQVPADVAAAFDRAKQAILAAVGHINRALAGDP